MVRTIGATASGDTPARRRRAIRLARVAQLRAAGLSVRQIAARLEQSTSTVWQDLTRLGLGGGGPAPREARSGRWAAPSNALEGACEVFRPEHLAGSEVSEPATVVGRNGALPGAPAEDWAALLRRLSTTVDQARLARLTFERRRHAQELAALKAQAERWRHTLEARLALQTARAEELLERVALAEQRAAVATAQLRAVERAFEAAGRPALVALLRARLAAPGPATHAPGGGVNGR